MSNARNIASGAKFVDTSGDTMTGTLVAGTRLQVGDSSITQAYTQANFGYVADFQASSGTQTYISIAAPQASSLGDNGVIIGEDATDTYITQRGNKNIKLATQDLIRLVVDGSGRVTKPYQPAFRAYPTSTQANVTGASQLHSNGYTWTSLFNIGNHFNNSGTFTAPVAGSYLFIGHWTVYGSDSNFGDAAYHMFIKNNNTNGNNGSYATSGMSMWDPRGSTWDQLYTGFGGSAIMNLAANDAVTMYGGVLDGGGNNLDLVGSNVWYTTIMSGYLIG